MAKKFKNNSTRQKLLYNDNKNIIMTHIVYYLLQILYVVFHKNVNALIVTNE